MDVKKDVAEQVPAVTVDSVRWLRMRRATIDAASAPLFGRDLRNVRDDLEQRPGHGVGVAIGMTLAAIALAILAIVVGALVMEMAAGMIDSFSSAAGSSAMDALVASAGGAP